jgi:hypothetical protein
MKIAQYIISSAMCALALTISPAQAAPTASIGSGTTTVRFNDAFNSKLASENIRLSKVEESSLRRNLVTFPVIEGALDLADARISFDLRTSSSTLKIALQSSPLKSS